MTEDRFRKYDELEDDEKEVLDVFRQMKLLANYNKFKFRGLNYFYNQNKLQKIHSKDKTNIPT